jgi:hypothetical protein
MLPATFSRSDVTASQEESPPFPRKRQSVTTEGGEDVKVQFSFTVGRTRSRSHWLAECIIMRLIPVSPMIWRR